MKEISPLKDSVANTALALHANRLYATLEANLPFHLKIERTEKEFDIKSIGHDDFDGQLTHNVSAHPKVDRKTGDFLAFGYDGKTGVVHYSLINEKRKLVSKMDIPLTCPRMIHDFGITENYIIVPDLPIEFDIKTAIKEGKSVL